MSARDKVAAIIATHQVKHPPIGSAPSARARCWGCQWESDPIGPSHKTGTQLHADHVAVLITEADGDAVSELCDALRLTAEYFGPQNLPASPGWSWFDALSKYAPDVAQAFAQERLNRNPAAVAAIQRAERALAEGLGNSTDAPSPAPKHFHS